LEQEESRTGESSGRIDGIVLAPRPTCLYSTRPGLFGRVLKKKLS
jgi:hypothetical protein